MGGLAGSIYDLFSGDPTSSEQGALKGISTFENNTGEGAVNTGLGFENSILSGDPSKIAQVEAPEIRAGQDMIQQTAEQNAMFGNRGGGTNSSTNAAQSKQRGDIINLTGQLQQGAAGAELGAGENLLGQGSTNLMNEANLATQNQQRVAGDVGGIASGVASIASPFLGGLTGGGGGLDPGSFSDLFQSGKAGIPAPTPIDESSLFTGEEQQM